MVGFTNSSKVGGVMQGRTASEGSVAAGTKDGANTSTEKGATAINRGQKEGEEGTKIEADE